MPNQKRQRHKELRRQKVAAQRKAQQRQRLLRRIAISAGVAVIVVVTAYGIFSGSGTSTTTSPSTTTTVQANTTTTLSGSFISQAQVNAASVAAGCPSSLSARVNTMSWTSAPTMSIDTSKTYYADFVTSAGKFTMRLDAKAAPKTVNNFVFLARAGFYHCVIFHRVIPGFVIQGGDPTGTGSGGPGYSFADELPTGSYPLYSVAMANSGANTNGSQFFIVTGTSGEQLPDSYSRFGQVISGFSTITAIDAAGSTAGVPPTVTHRIFSVTIHN